MADSNGEAVTIESLGSGTEKLNGGLEDAIGSPAKHKESSGNAMEQPQQKDSLQSNSKENPQESQKETRPSHKPEIKEPKLHSSSETSQPSSIASTNSND
ncbi:hypothetical protein YYG_03853 [Plasmodium vinckei petteri]|uniref:Uncharacterized protein n=1 Tax=Plasmodium vinckei petteri TaxID=138298 RepID=W7AZ26_PLAVN|nr:hypothetical protein YYG_03853 [Plasmodium vinckei petteri]